MKIRNVDVFVLVNIGLFFLQSVLVYFKRFLFYRGPGNVHEFFIYGCVILGFILVAWWYLRHFPFSNTMLLLTQIGILAHYAGGYFPIEGGRLYDATVLGIGYDKYVHFLNAFTACMLLNHVFDGLNVHLPLIRGFVIVMGVLGLGAVVEIMEYLVVCTVPNAGVGGYDNNMQDMIGNFGGGLFFYLGKAMSARLQHYSCRNASTGS